MSNDDSTAGIRQRETQWLQDNKDWLEANHPGEWVALQGDELLAVGQDLQVVLETARQKGIEVPFIDAVRSKKYQGVVMFRRWN